MTFTIAHINVARDYRGGERQTELLIKELGHFDVRQILVACKDSPLAQRIQSPGLETRTVSGNHFGVAAACRGVDIMHVHEGRSVYAAYLRSLISGTPYIVTRRVDNPVRKHWLSHRAYRRAAVVTAVAGQVGKVLRRHNPQLNPQIVHSASSGLAVDKARSKEIREAYPGKCLVGHVGALDNEQKGQEFIIEVARQLQQSHPDIQFLLVGGGEDETMLKEMAAGLSNLTFVGFVENVGDFLAAFDVFILPSRKEGIGGILLDAMEQRLPVIASNVGGVAEIVKDGENGILIEAARPDQLQAAILHLCREPQLRLEMGERGSLVAKHFTASVMCEKYLKIYRSVLGQND